MHPTTLFTSFVALLLTILSCASALPNTFEQKAPTPDPRSLLGRTYLRHAPVDPPSALPRAIVPAKISFVGRAERFQEIRRRREHERREAAAPQLHMYPAEEPQELAEVQQQHQNRGVLFTSDV